MTIRVKHQKDAQRVMSRLYEESEAALQMLGLQGTTHLTFKFIDEMAMSMTML